SKYSPFTGFDPDDNLMMYQIMPKSDHRPLFHVINMAINLVHGENLAWQQRKTDSFTASPLHCGNSRLGYRLSNVYGGGMDYHHSPITLGGAVSISGAAANPNMGYHS